MIPKTKVDVFDYGCDYRYLFENAVIEAGCKRRNSLKVLARSVIVIYRPPEFDEVVADDHGVELSKLECKIDLLERRFRWHVRARLAFAHQ